MKFQDKVIDIVSTLTGHYRGPCKSIRVLSVGNPRLERFTGLLSSCSDRECECSREAKVTDLGSMYGPLRKKEPWRYRKR